MKKLSLRRFSACRTFGVELEWTRNLSRDALSDIIRSFKSPGGDDFERTYITTYQHNSDPRAWYCKTDSSCGYEVASRVLGGETEDKTLKDLGLLVRIHKKMVESGARVSSSCGMHVHLGMADFDDDELHKALIYWVKFEKMTFDMLPRRRKTSSYCGCRSAATAPNCLPSKSELFDSFENRGALSIRGITQSRSKTIEVRCCEGTEDSRTVKNWVLYLLLFFEKVKSWPTPTNCRWLTLPKGLKLLGLLDDENSVVLDPILSELREWILARTAAYSNFIDAAKNRELAKTLHMKLYPTPYGCALSYKNKI